MTTPTEDDMDDTMILLPCPFCGARATARRDSRFTDLFKVECRQRHRDGWKMPAAPWWKRLPVIRHVRVIYHVLRLVIWRKHWEARGYVPNGHDDWVLFGMLRGWEERADG